jgi:hypothetical protein
MNLCSIACRSSPGESQIDSAASTAANTSLSQITQHNSDRFRTSDLFKIMLGGQRYEEFTRH